MKSFRFSIFPFCFFAIVHQLSAQQLPEPTDDFVPRLFHFDDETTHGMYDKGVKAGWNETKAGWEVGEDGEMVFRYVDYDETTGLYFNRRQTNTWKLEAEFSSEPPFRLLSERVTETARGFTQEILITRDESKDDEIAYKAEINDGKATRVVPIEGDCSVLTLRNWMSAEHLVASEPEIGTRIENHYLDTDELKMDKMTIEVRKLVSDPGETPRYELGFIDDKMGTYLIGELDINGIWETYRYTGGMRWVREDRETVKLGLGDYVFDDLWLLAADRPLGNATSVVQLAAELDGDWTGIAQSTDLQKVVYDPDRDVTKIEVGSGIPEAVSEDDRKDNLRPTVDIPADDPEIAELAREIVGDVEDPWEQATLLAAWISRTIDYQIDLDPLSVVESLREKRGDCSEYSDLFAALARSLGIPTRSVSGWVYMGDWDQAFGYHAWNEVGIDGYWRSVDSTWCEIFPSATHIKMDTSEADSKFITEFREGESVLRVLDVKLNGNARRNTLKTLIEKYPNEAAWYADRGGLELMEENYAKAKRDFQKAIELAPEVGEYRYDLSNVFESMGKIEATVRQLRKATDLSPGHPEYWAELGFFLSELGEFEGAANAYSKAIEIQPHNSDHYYSRSYVWRSAGNAEAALSDIEEALRLAPDDASNINSKGLIYFGNFGDYAKAEEAFFEAVALDPSDPVYADNLAQARQNQAKYGLAAKELAAALEIHRESDELHNRLGLILLDAAKYEAAEDAFAESLCITPENPDYAGNLAYSLQLQARYDAALEVLEEALNYDREEPWLHNRRALIYFARGDYAQAEKNFTVAMSLVPEAPLFVRNRADAKLQQRDIKGAMKDAELAMKLSGDDEDEKSQTRELISRIESIEISQ